MSTDKSAQADGQLTVKISLDEHDGQAMATARLHGRNQMGVGRSPFNTADRVVASIGDELAVARALSDLARRMMGAAAHDIETATKPR